MKYTDLYNNSQKGFSLVIIFFLLTIILAIVLTISTVVFNGIKVISGVGSHVSLHYAAESGIENALYLLKTDIANGNPNLNYNDIALSVEGIGTITSISPNIGGSRTITAKVDTVQGDSAVRAVYSIDVAGVAFHYGAQVGAGGLQMANGSVINGSVYSNGNIIGSGSATIKNDAVVATNGNMIQSVLVEGNAFAYTCQTGTIKKDLTYVTGGANSCIVEGSINTQAGEIAAQALPISQARIDDWKAETANGAPMSGFAISNNETRTDPASVITGNVDVGNGATWNSNGITKIIGNLTLNSSAVVNLGGTLYVTGAIEIGNGATIQLTSPYGSLSGIVLADGIITVSNGGIINGSGETGSYVLVLSTNAHATSAIIVGNGSTSEAIFYAGQGGIQVNNGSNARELTGNYVSLGNNAILSYETGLSSVFFSSGPSGKWRVADWEEQ